jgi:hypothetical protein
MITYQEAVEKVRELINNRWDLDVKVSIIESYTIENNICWVFFYGNPEIELAGNAPLIVDKEFGNVYITGTAEDINFYLKAFKELYKEYKTNPKTLQNKIP